MCKPIALFVSVAIAFISSSSFAVTPRFQFGETWGLSVPNGTSDITAGIPSTLVGVGASTTITEEWIVFSDMVFAVPRTKFYPRIRPVIGTMRKFDGWALAGSILYQWNPPFAAGSKDVHTVGPTLALVLPLKASGVSFSFGLGYRVQLTGDKLTHVFSFGPGLFFSF